MKRSLLLRGRDDKDQDEEEMDNIIRRLGGVHFNLHLHLRLAFWRSRWWRGWVRWKRWRGGWLAPNLERVPVEIEINIFDNLIETLQAIPLVPFSSRSPPLKTKVQDFQTGELLLQETFFEVACSVIYNSMWTVPVLFTFLFSQEQVLTGDGVAIIIGIFIDDQ